MHNKVTNGIKVPNGRTPRFATAVIVFLILHSSFFIPCNAQIGRTSTYDFLNLPVSAHSAALGGNFIGVRDDDLSLAAQNPSFLSPAVNNQVALTYVPFLGGIDYDYFSIAHTVSNIGTFEAMVKEINYGSFTQADNAGNILGTFTASEIMYNLGYGRSVGKDSILSAGANIKYVSSSLYNYTSSGALVDLGVSYISHSRILYLGAVVENVGPMIKDYTSGNTEPLPFDVHMGISIKFKHAPFRLNLVLQHLQKWNLTYIDPADTQTVNPLTGQAITTGNANGFFDKLGRHIIMSGEILLGKNFAIRVGYNYEMRKELELVTEPGLSGISGGFEMKIYKFHINYALAKYALAGSSNTFTFILKFSDFYTRKPS